MTTHHLTAFAALLLATTTTTASAGPVRADVEVDPTAYALSGHSIHAGIAWGHLRLDLGNFAMALPQWVHGEDDFDVSFDGYGAKVHYFLRDDQTGLFGGVGVGLARVHVKLEGSDRTGDDLQLATGVEVGYRLALPHGFHATAWLGVGAASFTDPVMLDGKTFESPRLQIFPALHLGYRFR
ncbi:MAG: hypothetical protein JNL83_33130 [Myxococcales bacterium]|nr:hypothetical protein [Myxococcales bacterium]